MPIGPRPQSSSDGARPRVLGLTRAGIGLVPPPASAAPYRAGPIGSPALSAASTTAISSQPSSHLIVSTMVHIASALARLHDDDDPLSQTPPSPQSPSAPRRANSQRRRNDANTAPTSSRSVVTPFAHPPSHMTNTMPSLAIFSLSTHTPFTRASSPGRSSRYIGSTVSIHTARSLAASPPGASRPSALPGTLSAVSLSRSVVVVSARAPNPLNTLYRSTITPMLPTASGNQVVTTRWDIIHVRIGWLARSIPSPHLPSSVVTNLIPAAPNLTPPPPLVGSRSSPPGAFLLRTFLAAAAVAACR